MTFITDHEIKFLLRSRYRAPDAEYAIRCADEYAEHHAPDALPPIKTAIAQLYLRYTLQCDPGERRLIRLAIDQLVAMGESIHARTH
jgi:hypothetical protein